MLAAVNDSNKNVAWTNLGTPDARFWVLFAKDGGKEKVVITGADRAIQETYATDLLLKEDLLTIFVDPEAAGLYVAAISRQVGRELNDSFRIVSMSNSEFLQFLKNFDRQYVLRGQFFRADVCEYKNGQLFREIFFSRLIPKH